jgi:hypothetical protein
MDFPTTFNCLTNQKVKPIEMVPLSKSLRGVFWHHSDHKMIPLTPDPPTFRQLRPIAPWRVVFHVFSTFGHGQGSFL